uniref:Uncharacterized protein n=1 Tax=Hyaloperonospora arabidopsidis (strain Emoy2) TaxID=559515 RepID=M4C320_HYAAE
MIFNLHHLRRDTKSTKLTTNRCWTRAMGGEQETMVLGTCVLDARDGIPLNET